MDARCQICGGRFSAWRVTEARFDVGVLKNYKVQVCDDCTERIEAALISVLAIRKQVEPLDAKGG